MSTQHVAATTLPSTQPAINISGKNHHITIPFGVATPAPQEESKDNKERAAKITAAEARMVHEVLYGKALPLEEQTGLAAIHANAQRIANKLMYGNLDHAGGGKRGNTPEKELSTEQHLLKNLLLNICLPETHEALSEMLLKVDKKSLKKADKEHYMQVLHIIELIEKIGFTMLHSLCFVDVAAADAKRRVSNMEREMAILNERIAV